MCLQKTTEYPCTVTRKNLTLPPTDPHVHITALEGHFGIMHSAKLKVSGNKLFYLNVIIIIIIIAFLVYFLGTNAKYCSVLFGLNWVCLNLSSERTINGLPKTRYRPLGTLHCVCLYEIHIKALYGNSQHNAKQRIHFVAVYRHHLVASENFIWFQRTEKHKYSGIQTLSFLDYNNGWLFSESYKTRIFLIVQSVTNVR